MSTVKKILSDLISIPSVNPMSDFLPKDDPNVGEVAVSNYLTDYFSRLGIDVERLPVFPGRDNVIAVVGSPSRRRKAVLIDAHMDTVPVDNMTIPPFRAVEKRERIYGRGACDTKGTMAAALVAIERLIRSGRDPKMPVIFAGMVDEEYMYSGVKVLVRHPIMESVGFAISTEPTSLNVVVAHKGLLEWHIETRGKAAHGARPQEGINAVYRMGELLLALESYNSELGLGKSYERLGTATLNVGCIRGGNFINSVPDRCVIDIEYRLMPKDIPEKVLALIDEFLRTRAPDVDFEFSRPFLIDPPLDVHPNTDQVLAYLESAKRTFPSCRTVGIDIGTNASKISSEGIPCVVFGAGSIEQAHSQDEWVSVRELELASDIFLDYFLNGESP